MKFEREDWTSFRTIEGLQQKAGVTEDKLRRLVLKEITDNGLDNGSDVRIGELPRGGYFIEDDGPGIDGTPEDVARLFSIARPMVSTKLLRLPKRGALGNGLRVVAGAVLASEGSLTVVTRNRRIKLRPERDGSTTVVSAKPVKFANGTRIEITFGPAIPEDNLADHWASFAILLARPGRPTRASRHPTGTICRNFTNCFPLPATHRCANWCAHLDGCTGGRAGEIVAAAGLSRMVCGDVSREQATNLLKIARDNARPVNPKRLGMVGPDAFPGAYAITYGTTWFGAAEPLAEIPFCVEAWASENSSDMRSGRLRQSHTRRRGNLRNARQAGRRHFRMRTCPHCRASAEGQKLYHPSQRHDSVHADHQRRQGAKPRTISRRNPSRRSEGRAEGAPSQCREREEIRKALCSNI